MSASSVPAIGESFQGQTLGRVSSPGETQELISKFLWPHRLRITGRSGFVPSSLTGLFLGDAALFKLHYGNSVEVNADGLACDFLVQTTINGLGHIYNGSRKSDVRPGVTTVISPNQTLRLITDGPWTRLIARISHAKMARHLSELLDQELHDPLIFDLTMDHDRFYSTTWLQTLNYIMNFYAHNAAAPNFDYIKQHHSNLILSLLLHGHNHNYSELLKSGNLVATPRHVRHARDYIENYCDKPITMADLARETGVSARTLQNGFRRFLDQTPTAYIRSVRLTRIHNALKNAGPDDSVTGIMLRYGVSNPGRFAQIYRRRYGCLPSETLRNALT